MYFLFAEVKTKGNKKKTKGNGKEEKQANN